MESELFTFLVGGKAGEGIKKAGSVAAQIFSKMGRHVFQMDDYMSLIRGGHNFSVVSTDIIPLTSQYLKAQVSVNFDIRSYEKHRNDLMEDGIMIYNSDEIKNGKGIGIPFSSEAKKYPLKTLMFGVGAVATLSAIIGVDKKRMNVIIREEYPRGIEDNIAYAEKIYDLIYPDCYNKFQLLKGDNKRPIISGNEAISLGAVAGGLDAYYAYPMTPASSILHFLASHAENFGVVVVHPESEIAVVNMAIGSAFTGAKSMVGTSGGGFALMAEGISLAGITETPLLIVLSMRPGPATGVATYTEQGDLGFALNVGHGEFLRIIASPGSVKEAFYLTSEMLDLVWKFQTPGILLTEKHLSESSMTVNLNVQKAKWVEPKIHEGKNYLRYLDTEDGISPLLFPPNKEIIKYNSNEHDEEGISTEEPEIIEKMHNKRKRKIKALENYLKNVNTVNVYGSEEPFIFTYGSTTMSVLEALKYVKVKATVVQPIYLNPLPVWILDKYKEKKAIVIEMSSIGQFSQLLQEKVGIKFHSEIRKYDGRPFDPIELSNKLMEVLK
ncbi:MAG: 2-oxoacid:acceptor oxidoreductase subunit alpha [Candidatus Thorarchaeota archaeon]